jgi:nucleotide-binding universal stress UspA family protein
MSDQFIEAPPHVFPAERRQILAPVDFSSCSEAALLFAAHFASCVQAPLLVLHVVHEPNNEPGFYQSKGHGAAGMSRPIEDTARDMLAAFIAEVSGHVSAARALATAQMLLVSGLPGARIQEVAAQEDAALIVMGTHGRTGLSRLTVGSVAADVSRHSRVPVTIVKAVEERNGQVPADVIGSTEWWTRRMPVQMDSASDNMSL